jgi:hypothetical protein
MAKAARSAGANAAPEAVLRDLGQSLERLGRSLESAVERLEQSVERAARQMPAAPAPPTNPADRLSRHVQRYLPLYALGLVWVLMIALVPSVDRRAEGRDAVFDSSGRARDSGASAATDSAPLGGGTTDAGPAAATAPGGPGVVRLDDRKAAVAGSAPLGEVRLAVGTTVGGFGCKLGVRQIPWSFYAPPCVAKFEGNNGGATSRGVTKDTIKIVWRNVPSAVAAANPAQVTAYREQFGQPDPEVDNQVRDELIKFFNKTYELYGRKVVLERFDSNSESTQEALGNNSEQACADATHIAADLKAFAVWPYMSAVFTNCAAKDQHLLVPLGQQYYAEGKIRSLGWHPYVWNITGDCDRIGFLMAEYMGKRLRSRKAKYAGQLSLRSSVRKMGWYVPDDDGYNECVDAFVKKYASYGDDPGMIQRYTLDPTRWPDQGARAAVAFKAAGVTSVTLGTAPIIALFLQQGAKQQNYWPEWLTFGVAGSDVDSQAQGMDQEESKGHMFGMSELAPTLRLLGKEGEANLTYKAATGKDLPANALGSYYELVHVFNMLMLAGPNLTPLTVHEAMHAMPPIGKGGAHGTWCFCLADPHPRFGDADHSAHDDVREIYWDGDATSPTNGKAGTFKELNGGRRFLPGEWPTTEPEFPVVPDTRP